MRSQIPEREVQSDPIFSETLGRGEDVVLVHGWAMHGGFWREFAQGLARGYRVTCLDLPGHGRSAPIDDYAPERIAAALVRSAPQTAHWIGWSLGATLVLTLCGLFPERVKTIVLIAGNPKFASAPDWLHALRPEALDQFNRNLLDDFKPALLRFLKVQTLGLESSRETYRTLKSRLNECDAPHPDALRAGIGILKATDHRERLRTLDKPVLVLLGAQDSLVPVGVSESILRLKPSVDLRIIQNAGHIPFITHRDQCLAEVLGFLSRHRAGSNA
ncbi:MAG: pimeloyl-ACP methyl ester esterase BioH [Methylococcaceae bacterium]|nr:pimeloyl-ACP methyl ester esterase BioH [Methylococcaceae bacterium]